MEPELIADYECVVGEGPLWHAGERRLYWLDILTGRFFRYDPATGAHEQVYSGEQIGGFTVQADGALLLFGARGAVRVWRDGVIERTIIEEIEADRDSRFNDVIADPLGGVFCGTMAGPAGPGRLYRLTPAGELTTVLEDIQVPNGLGFTPDRRGLYFTDTMRGVILRFDYDPDTGAASNQRVFASVPKDEAEGLPDGMTVDREGFVWSARWGGGCLVRYAPDGTEVARVIFPANKVSSAVFGGEDYADLYVTTAGGDNKAEDGPGAGALYRLRPDVPGAPEFVSRVEL